MIWTIYPNGRFFIVIRCAQKEYCNGWRIEFSTVMFFPLLRFPRLFAWRVAARKRRMERAYKTMMAESTKDR